MDETAHKAEVAIRSQEPEDAAQVSALMGGAGTFEGTLQLPDMPVAMRLELLQKVDPSSCRLVALDGTRIVGAAGLHPVGTTLRRAHVRALGIVVAREWQGRGVGRQLIARLLDWSDNWAQELGSETNFAKPSLSAVRLAALRAAANLDSDKHLARWCRSPTQRRIVRLANQTSALSEGDRHDTVRGN